MTIVVTAFHKGARRSSKVSISKPINMKLLFDNYEVMRLYQFIRSDTRPLTISIKDCEGLSYGRTENYPNGRIRSYHQFVDILRGLINSVIL